MFTYTEIVFFTPDEARRYESITQTQPWDDAGVPVDGDALLLSRKQADTLAALDHPYAGGYQSRLYGCDLSGKNSEQALAIWRNVLNSGSRLWAGWSRSHFVLVVTQAVQIERLAETLRRELGKLPAP